MPEFITNYRHCPDEKYRRKYRPYTNIYEIISEESYVFGTESLYGDWDAELFIVASDVGPACEFERSRDVKHKRPFSHREWRPDHPYYDPTGGTGGARTNKTVYSLAEQIDCPKLYGSALIGMCRPGTQYSKDPCPPDKSLRDHCVSVLKWVLDPEQTPKLPVRV